MIQGDTVRLQVQFKSFEGQLINVNDVKLVIYKSDKTVLETITDVINQGMGRYYYDYTANEDFTFEFIGTYNDKPILVRDSVKVTYI